MLDTFGMRVINSKVINITVTKNIKGNPNVFVVTKTKHGIHELHDGEKTHSRQVSCTCEQHITNKIHTNNNTLC